MAMGAATSAAEDRSGVRVVELRVHGVSGSAPTEVLDRPLLRQVAGDKDAGFFVPREDYGATLGPAGAGLEAYSWGGLTSRAASRALWLLLLPFMLANLAAWMRPAAPAGGGSPEAAATARADRIAEAVVSGLCRTFAVSLTGTLVLAAAGIGLDLFAWQCPQRGCSANRSWLWLIADGTQQPGRRLALGALVPLTAVGVLWYLGRRTWARYEAYRPVVAGDGPGIAAPWFWYGRLLVGRLRSVHVAAAAAAILLALLVPIVSFDRSSAVPGWYPALGLGLLVAVVLVAVITIGVLWVPAVVNAENASGVAERSVRRLRHAGWVLVVAGLAYALLPRPDWVGGGLLPGYSTLVSTLFAGQVGVLAALTAAVAVQRHRCPVVQRAAFGGFGTPVVSLIALLLGAAFSAGATYRVADLLDGSSVPGPSMLLTGRPEGLQTPPSYEWAALGGLALPVLIGIVAVVVRSARWPLLRRRARAVVERDFPGGRLAEGSRLADIERAVAGASLSDSVPALLTWITLPIASIGLAVTALVVATGDGPVTMVSPGSQAAFTVNAAVNAGTWLTSLAVLGVVLLGTQAYRTPSTRRLVGILWDVGTFWPRSAHPLAPPCYAERAVPELLVRLRWHADRAGVVLSGHSQGSVISAAALLQLPRGLCDGVTLLTYGSPLARLYGRYFPAFFGPDVLGRVARVAGAGRWVNLYRDTDPIGGPVGEPGVDIRLRDPAGLVPADGNTVDPPIRGHSDYQADPEYERVVAMLLRLIRLTPRQRAPSEGPPAAV
jgi:hypothetical protein